MAITESVSRDSFSKRAQAAGIRRREWTRFFTALLYLLPSLILFTTFVFVPLVRTIGLSTYLTNPLGIAVKFVGLAQYEKLFDTPVFVGWVEGRSDFPCRSTIHAVPKPNALIVALANSPDT